MRDISAERKNNAAYGRDRGSTMENVLIVVDVQPLFSTDRAEYEKCLQFIKKHRHLYDEVVALKWIKGNTNFKICTDFDPIDNGGDLEFEYDKLVEKTGYGTDGFLWLLKYRENTHFDVIGCNTGGSVMKVAFDLFDFQLDFTILLDLCYSADKKAHDCAVYLMKQNFGVAAVSGTDNEHEEHIAETLMRVKMEKLRRQISEQMAVMS